MPQKTANFTEIVNEMLSTFELQGCIMNIKVHFLISHLGSFPENFDEVNDKHGKHFRQDIKLMEKLSQGRLGIHLLADYC